MVQVGQVVALLVVEVVAAVGWVLLLLLLLALLLWLVGLYAPGLGLQCSLLLVWLSMLCSWPLQLNAGLVFLHVEPGPLLFVIGS